MFVSLVEKRVQESSRERERERERERTGAVLHLGGGETLDLLHEGEKVLAHDLGLVKDGGDKLDDVDHVEHANVLLLGLVPHGRAVDVELDEFLGAETSRVSRCAGLRTRGRKRGGGEKPSLQSGACRSR